MFYYIMFCIWWASVNTIVVVCCDEQWVKDEVKEIWDSNPIFENPTVRKVVLIFALIVYWIDEAIKAPYSFGLSIVEYVRSR